MGRVYAVPGRRGQSWGIDYYADGRRIRRIIGRERRAAERELKKAEGLAASGQGAGPYGSRRIRFQAFADEYLTHQEATVAPSSAKRYKTALKVLVLAFGDRYLTSLRLADLERYKAARLHAVKPWTVIG